MNNNNNNYSIETGWKPVIRENSLEGLTVVGKIEKDIKNITKQCNVVQPVKDELKQKIDTQYQSEDLLKLYEKIDSVKKDIDKKLDRLSQDIDVLITIILENSSRNDSAEKKAPFINLLKKLGIYR